MCGGGVWGYGGEGEGVLKDWFPFSLSVWLSLVLMHSY